MDFHIGSGLAALTEIGNEAEDLHFYGGRYAILTDKTFAGLAVYPARFGLRGPTRGGDARA